MCGDEFANKYVMLLNIIINVLTKQKFAESSSDFVLSNFSYWFDFLLNFVSWCNLTPLATPALPNNPLYRNA